MKKLTLLLLAATLHSSGIYAISYYSYHDTLHVFALSGLRLRDRPDGEVTALVPYGSEIVMQESRPNDRRDTVENIPGHWTKTIWQGRAGYIFDGFLSRLPAPDTSLRTLEGYCERYFKKRKDLFIQGSSEVNSMDIEYYTYLNWYVELERIESAEGAEAYGYGATMTIKNSGDNFSPEEMYLLMRALFRSEIAECLEKIKAGKESSGFYRTAEENYFLFIRDEKSGSYEFPVDLYIFLDYGVCHHGAYIGFGAAD